MPLPRTPGRDTRGTHRNDDDPIPAIAAAHLIEPSSVARHNRPAQRDRTDESDAFTHTPAVSHHRAPNDLRPLTPA